MMKNKINIIGRYNSLSLICTSAFTLLTFTITSFVPAFLSGCTETNEIHACKISKIKTTIHKTGTDLLPEGSTIDIFVFNNDRLQRLDSYQRLIHDFSETQNIESRHGEKILVAIVNSHKDKYKWVNINSYESVLSTKADLEDEENGNLLMSGTGYINASKEPSCHIEVSPLASEIILNSIKCDFSSKPYKNASLTGAKAYLTNVNASASIMQESEFLSERIINLSGCSEEDLNNFKDPEIIFKEFEKPVSHQIQRPGIRFLCYPNEVREESPGSPFTKLVIEGDINGRKYYYPISINRDANARGGKIQGVGRNCRYIYDIVIKSLGSTDPDTDLSPEMAEVSCLVSDWHEKEETEIFF